MKIKEQIKALREAIKIEEENKIKAEEHATKFRSLQKIETTIKNRISKLEENLRGVQAKIVEQLNITFDVSDDMTIEAAKETLKNLEEKQNEIL